MSHDAPRALHAVELRFYEELGDFLPEALRRRSFVHRFAGTRSVKDLVESLGVPHPEIDLILVDGVSVDFDHLVGGGERIAVYPEFERLDIAPIVRLRPAPLRDPRFVCDVHLGTLARDLRLLGFDTTYATDFDDATIVRIAVDQHRIVLTRDRGILVRKAVTHGHWIRSTDPFEQIVEVASALHLTSRFDPFTRCRECNAELRRHTLEELADALPSHAAREYDAFARCTGCQRIYWRGSHYDRLQERVARIAEGVASITRSDLRESILTHRKEGSR